MEIDVDGDRLRMREDSDSTPEKLSMLDDRTKTFMKAFAFRTIQLKQPKEQMQFIEENPAMVAARSIHIGVLMQNVTLKTATEGTRRMEPVRSAPPTAETIVISLALRSPSQIALFADKIIEERLFTFIERTFQIRTKITSSGTTNQRVVEITGLKSAVERAREALLTFPSLCRTKVYDHPAGKTNSSRSITFTLILSFSSSVDQNSGCHLRHSIFLAIGQRHLCLRTSSESVLDSNSSSRSNSDGIRRR